MKKSKVATIILALVSSVFLGLSLYLYHLYLSRTEANTSRYIAIGNEYMELSHGYENYFTVPWYIQLAPELILLAGVASTALVVFRLWRKSWYKAARKQ